MRLACTLHEVAVGTITAFFFFGKICFYRPRGVVETDFPEKWGVGLPRVGLASIYHLTAFTTWRDLSRSSPRQGSKLPHSRGRTHRLEVAFAGPPPPEVHMGTFLLRTRGSKPHSSRCPRSHPPVSHVHQRTAKSPPRARMLRLSPTQLRRWSG